MADKSIALKAPPPEKKGDAAPDTWAQPQYAFLEMWEPKHVKGGKPELGSLKDKITFQFNPKEVSITKSAKWERKPTKEKKAGPPEYSGAEPCKLSLELYFDAAAKDGVDVVASVDKLFSCCVPCKEVQKGEAPMPFLVVFNWGQVKSSPPTSARCRPSTRGSPPTAFRSGQRAPSIWRRSTSRPTPSRTRRRVRCGLTTSTRW